MKFLLFIIAWLAGVGLTIYVAYLIIRALIKYIGS